MPAAKCVAVHGALLMRTKTGGWDSVAAKSSVPAGRLLVALFGAEFESPNGAIEMRMIADVGQRGPFPVLEAAVQFNVAKKADLDVTLDRGIVVFVNKKKVGAAHLLLHMRDETFEVTLAEPKAKLGVEVYGRHVPGPANLTDAKKDDPVASVAFFALEGEVVIGAEKHVSRLQAPPGNALYLWDSLTRQPEISRFETLPDSVKPFDAKEKAQFLALCLHAKTMADKPGEIGAGIYEALRSKDPVRRKVAVVALGALDQYSQLMQELGSKDHADVRDMAVLVLRHWLGRQPGQTVRLYEFLTKVEGYTPVQAKSFLHLCYGIEADQRRQPSTYDLLIQGLNHSKAPMRELAHWHLVRLAPDGKAIPYDAAAAEPQRLQAIEAWRRLIPEGELPPSPKKKTGTN